LENAARFPLSHSHDGGGHYSNETSATGNVVP